MGRQRARQQHGRAPEGAPPAAAGWRPPAWLAPLAILLVVWLGYGIAPTRLPLVGEETRRAQHGIEMAQSGDWLIARHQGLPILDRPPGQYWVLALLHRAHPLDEATLRWFMVALTALTSLVAWAFARRFSELAGLVAGLAYPTFGHVFDLGRRVEADGLFTLWLGAALLVWYAGHARRWPAGWTWGASAVLAALASLTKGLQGPVAFFGGVWGFLLVTRDWRVLRSGAHAFGLLLFLALIAAWQVPFQQVAGTLGTYASWLQPGTSRVSVEPARFLGHLASFPLRVLAATLPWSPLLLAFALPSVRRALDPARRRAAAFLGWSSLCVLGPVWLTADGNERYVMPMYPLLAVLCALVVEQAASWPEAARRARLLRGSLRALAGLALLAGVALLPLAFLGERLGRSLAERWAQPWPLGLVVLLAGACAARVLWRAARAGGARSAARACFALAAFVAVLQNGPLLQARVQVAEDVGPAVRALHARLPAGTELVSLGRLHHKFVFYWGDPVRVLERSEHGLDELRPGQCFALDLRAGETLELPFAFEELARLSMDRKRKATPDVVVVVGRRAAGS